MNEQEKAAAEAAAAEETRLAEEAAAKAKADEEGKEKSDADKTAAEIEAEAKELEEQVKAKKEEEALSPEAKEARKKSDQLIRRDKLKAELGDNKDDQPKEVAVNDLITLGKEDIDEDSETAKVLQKYVDAGIVKTYKEGLEHAGVKGELAQIKTDEEAKAVLDENDSEDAKLATKKERVANYRQSGEVPADAEQQKEIADANLEEMGLK